MLGNSDGVVSPSILLPSPAIYSKVRLITLTVSLGGVESLIEHPASMTHATVPRKEREASGILDDLVGSYKSNDYIGAAFNAQWRF